MKSINIEDWLRGEAVRYGLQWLIKEVEDMAKHSWQDWYWIRLTAALENFDKAVDRVVNNQINNFNPYGAHQIEATKNGISAKTFIGKNFPECFEVFVSWGEIKELIIGTVEKNPTAVKKLPSGSRKQITFDDFLGEVIK